MGLSYTGLNCFKETSPVFQPVIVNTRKKFDSKTYNLWIYKIFNFSSDKMTNYVIGTATREHGSRKVSVALLVRAAEGGTRLPEEAEPVARAATFAACIDERLKEDTLHRNGASYLCSNCERACCIQRVGNQERGVLG